MPLTLPPERVKLPPLSTFTPLPPALLLPTLPPERVKLPPLTFTQYISPLTWPVMEPLPTGSAAVALESVTVRSPPMSTVMMVVSLIELSRVPSIVKPQRSSVTSVPQPSGSFLCAPSPSPRFTLPVSL